jgi:hypothetical protein
MRPTPPSSGALFPLNVRHFGAFCRTRVGAEFLHGKMLRARFIHAEVQNGERVTELEGEKWQKA